MRFYWKWFWYLSNTQKKKVSGPIFCHFQNFPKFSQNSFPTDLWKIFYAVIYMHCLHSFYTDLIVSQICSCDELNWCKMPDFLLWYNGIRFYLSLSILAIFFKWVRNLYKHCVYLSSTSILGHMPPLKVSFLSKIDWLKSTKLTFLDDFKLVISIHVTQTNCLNLNFGHTLVSNSYKVESTYKSRP